MTEKAAKKYVHAQWSSRWVFILAATGSAVGLGNVWKFPYTTGVYGGGAFVLIYLLCVAAIGVPIMMAEVMLGRRGRQSPINTMRKLARAEGASPLWGYLGWLGVLSGFLILSYYSVIAGWTLAYFVRTATGVFSVPVAGGMTPDGVQAIFAQFVSNPEALLAWHTLFMILTVVVVARGVQSGLEKAVRWLMPALFILLLVLVGYAMNTDGFAQAMEFLFRPDFSKITAPGVLSAMGQAFFSLSLGMGAIMIYGSYLPSNASIAGTSVTIAAADTLVALLAGIAIFPIVFANGLEPAAGPSLIFQTLPLAFGKMAGGDFFGALFFLLLVFAAWTSAISLIEPVVAWMAENHGLTRVMATAVAGTITWVLGIVTILSFNHWKFSFSFFGDVKENGMFDVLDILTANIMLPVGGIFIAIFAGWIMKRRHSEEEMAIRTPGGYDLWWFLVRFVSPVLMIFVLLHLLGLF